MIKINASGTFNIGEYDIKIVACMGLISDNFVVKQNIAHNIRAVSGVGSVLLFFMGLVPMSKIMLQR